MSIIDRYIPLYGFSSFKACKLGDISHSDFKISWSRDTPPSVFLPVIICRRGSNQKCLPLSAIFHFMGFLLSRHILRNIPLSGFSGMKRCWSHDTPPSGVSLYDVLLHSSILYCYTMLYCYFASSPTVILPYVILPLYSILYCSLLGAILYCSYVIYYIALCNTLLPLYVLLCFCSMLYCSIAPCSTVLLPCVELLFCTMFNCTILLLC